MHQRVPAALRRADLGRLGAAVAPESGESLGIYRLTGGLGEHGLLFKEYKKTAVRNGRDAALEQLIEFGRSTAAVGRAEREVLLGATSWPVAKVTDASGDLIGCLIPEADRKFRSESGKPREIDILAQPPDRLAQRGMSVTPDQRLAVSRAFVAVAAALERRALVYSDWNYANAFWCPADSAVFVIDIDGCRPERMPNIFQNGWEDPLTNSTAAADMYTDRFRVALLTARCLTGQRRLPAVLHALDEAAGNAIPAGSILLDMLWAADRTDRPASRSLLTALGGVELQFSVTRRPLPERPAVPGRKIAPPVRKTPVTTQKKPSAPTRPETRGPVTPRPPAKSGSSSAASVFWFFVIVVFIIVGLVLANHH